MIVSRGLGRGANRGSIVGAGLTRRSTVERILTALEFTTLAPMRALKANAATMYTGFKTLISPNGSDQ